MPLTQTDRLLVEAIKNMLKHDDKLGLSIHDTDTESKAERGSQYLHEQIDEMFSVRAANLIHADSVCRAFHKVHSYKYIDDLTFIPALLREMAATAVPEPEREKAINIIPGIVSELYNERRNWSERDAGFNPRLDEIVAISQPEQPLDLKIERRRLNQRNLDKPQHGDGSPAHITNKPPLPGESHEVDE